MCVNSREQKKPILALVMRESTEACFTEALTTLVRADAVQEMIKEKFIFTGFAMN